MLEIVWMLLFIFAILLIIFAIEYRDNFYLQLVFLALDIPIWFILALSNMKIERPWEMYNVSSEQIETGIHAVTSSSSPFISYIFSGVGISMFIYLIVILVMSFKERD